MADVLLLSDRCANLFANSGSDKPNSVPDESSDDVRLRTLENVLYLAASAERGSEHPLAKGN